LTPGGSSTVHIYTKTVQYSTIQYTFAHKQYTERNIQNNKKKKFWMCSEGKVVPVQAMKAYRGSRPMTPFVLNLMMVQFTTRSL
jgi:hypothetical protein